MTTRSSAGLAFAAKYGPGEGEHGQGQQDDWRMSSQFLRSFWNGALAWVSERNRCQRMVLEMSLTTRLRLRR